MTPTREVIPPGVPARRSGGGGAQRPTMDATAAAAVLEAPEMSMSSALAADGARVRLVADDPAFPAIDLAAFRALSDRERMLPPGGERRKVQARLMVYLPALLDHLDELSPAAGARPGG